MESPKRPGRWRSGMESRQRILDAARASFAKHGYDRSSVRAIATDAGVDQAMVFYFFGTKAGLFTEAMRLPSHFIDSLGPLFADGIDGFGVRLVQAFVEGLDAADDLDPMFSLTRSAPTHDRSAVMLREFLDRELGDRLVRLLDGESARLRVALVSAQLLGLAVTRYVVALEPVASATPAELADYYGASVQELLTD